MVLDLHNVLLGNLLELLEGQELVLQAPIHLEDLLHVILKPRADIVPIRKNPSCCSCANRALLASPLRKLKLIRRLCLLALRHGVRGGLALRLCKGGGWGLALRLCKGSL